MPPNEKLVKDKFTVKSGYDFPKIAKEFKVPLQELKDFNEYEGEVIIKSGSHSFQVEAFPYRVVKGKLIPYYTYIGDIVYIPFSKKELAENDTQDILDSYNQPTNPWGYNSFIEPVDRTTTKCAYSDSKELSLEPCDIVSLTISDLNSIKAFNPRTYRSVTCSAKNSSFSSIDADLLFECVADFSGADNNRIEKTVSLEIEAKMSTKHCVQIKTKRNNKFTTVKKGKLVIQDILAPSPNWPDSIKSLEKYWRFDKDTETILFLAKGCGIPILPSLTPPNDNLTAKVVIYPKVDCSLSLNFTPFASLDYEKKPKGNSTLNKKFGKRKTTKEVEVNQVNGVDYKKISRSSESTGKGKIGGESATLTTIEKTVTENNVVATTGHTHILEKNERYLYSRKITDYAENDKIVDEFKVQGETTCKLTYNGEEINISRAANALVNIKNTFDMLTRAIKSIEETLPQVGLQIAFNVSAGNGSLDLLWGVRERSKNSLKNIAVVEKYIQITANFTLLSLELDVSFGIDFTIKNWFSSNPLVEVVALIYGKIKVAAQLIGTYDYTDADNTGLQLESSPSLTLGARLQASLMGYTAKAEISAKGEMTVTGDIIPSFSSLPSIDYTVIRKRCISVIELKCDTKSIVLIKELWKEELVYSSPKEEGV